MVKFTIFGIPVTIHPWFWLTLVLLSGGLSANDPEALISISLFVLAGAVSILVHELGHALVGRKLGGSFPTIELIAFGGVTYSHGGRFTRWQHFWRIAAGPGAGFILLFAVLACLGFAFGDHDAISLAKAELFHKGDGLSYQTVAFLESRPYLAELLRHLLWVNFWWGVLNLLPILPLDGGQIVNLFVAPQKRVHWIGIITSALMVLYALIHGQLYMAAFFGYHGVNNYKALQGSRWS